MKNSSWTKTMFEWSVMCASGASRCPDRHEDATETAPSSVEQTPAGRDDKGAKAND